MSGVDVRSFKGSSVGLMGALLCLIGNAGACGSDTSVKDRDAAAAAATSSQVIGPAGGAVTGPGQALVTIPADALSATTTITVTDLGAPGATPSGALPALPTNLKAASHALAFLPHGVTFAKAVTIRVPTDPALLARAAGRPLRLYTAGPGEPWVVVAAARPVAGALDADVRHFSFFIVGYEVPEQLLPEVSPKKLDLLFMIDNSQSMQPLQAKLTASFPVLIQTLKALPGGLPDLHLGVVSSTLGAGKYTAAEVQGCPHGGDGGRLQATPRGACVTGGPTDHFIAAGANESTKNYPGTIEDAFSCIAALGGQGCGFEHQLESMAVALGARGAVPPENAGFLRADATLGLVMITNEDDCSAPPDSDLFDPASSLVSDPLGPLNSYRCNEYGHLCAGAPPPRTSAATLTDCHSAEDGRLIKVAEYQRLFKALKPDPTQVFLAAIAAPPTPYQVTLNPPFVQVDPAQWPAIAHSCTGVTGEYGDPAVRIAELVTAFGANGSLSSICGDFAPALTGIGAAVTRATGPRCLQPDVSAPAGPPALAAGCAVLESVPVPGGPRTETTLPACGAGAAQPCWSVKANASCAPSGVELTLTRGDAAPAGAVLVVRCP